MYQTPKTPTQELLLRIVREVLNCDAIGIDDDLFTALDYDSLAAARIVSRIHNLFSTELRLDVLFEAPTVTQLANEIEHHRMSGQSLLPPLGPVLHQQPLPLSCGQQRLWYLDQLEGPNPTYNMPRALRMVGTLDLVALQRALGEVIRRHETLRTNFKQTDGQPVQVVHAPEDCFLPVDDLTHLSKVDQERQVAQRFRAEALRPFALDRDNLFRVRLLCLSDELHVFLLNVHHIVFDEWSLDILLSEMSKLYRGFLEGQRQSLPELPIQYSDYALCQRQWLAAGVLQAQLDYWRRQLDGAPAVVTLPSDYPRLGKQKLLTADLIPPLPDHIDAQVTLTISADLTDALKALSRETRVTLFMTLETVFVVFLHLYTASNDIPVGTPIANRHRREIEPLIGFFVNTLVLRHDLASNPTFRELLVRVRQTCLDAYSHQDVPFDKLVEILQPKRDLSYNPLFQVMFDLHETSGDSVEWPNLKVESMAHPETGAMFDLSLTIESGLQELRAVFDYNPRLFREATVRQWASHFHRILETATANPETRLSKFDLLSEYEKHQQVVDWNNVQETSPRRCLHHMFEEQVERRPDASAVYEGRSPFAFANVARQLSYHQLNTKANRLAHHLRTLGAGPEVRVGICVERSLEMIVGILAILKSGAAYVPLDPDYPSRRLAHMVADSNVAILLTRKDLEARLPVTDQPTVYVDAPEAEWSHYPETPPATEVTPDHLCYVIYTSGSTGAAKGVEITHAAASNLAHCMGRHYAVTEHDRYLQFASLSFDCAVEEIFPALLHGATLVLRHDDWLSTPATFLQCCRDEQLTIINLPTAYFHQMAQADDLDGFQSNLRLVAYGGQAARLKEVLAWRDKLGASVRLINTYGPTEATVNAAWWDLPSCSERFEAGAPIGSAFPNLQLYVFDRHWRLVPNGVPGELYVGGVGVARGYTGRPSLTAGAFVPDPFANEPGARMYRTGDLVKRLPDGNLVFVGRADQQRKIRGFRIEPAEIESVLSRHPGVSACVVSLVENREDNPELLAHIVPTQDAATMESELREHLKAELPAYMIPSAFVFMEQMPLTPNGKVDSAALPAPPAKQGDSGHVPPGNDDEQEIHDMWCELLGLASISTTTDFFDLGGHSLLATQLISRLNRSFGLTLPLRKIFEHPTIAALATLIEAEEFAELNSLDPEQFALLRKSDLP